VPGSLCDVLLFEQIISFVFVDHELKGGFANRLVLVDGVFLGLGTGVV